MGWQEIHLKARQETGSVRELGRETVTREMSGPIPKNRL
jgi:hypothetical protein